MSGLLGGRSTASAVEKLATIQISTSCYGHPKTLAYGTTRIAANMIDYDDFKATATKSSGGKGGGGGTTGYTYTAGVILALCEGGSSGIVGVNRVWCDKDVYTLSYYRLSLLTGSRPQSPWATWTSKHPTKALGYSGTALICAASMSLGSGGSVPNYNFETRALLATEQDPNFTTAYDAKPSAVIVDFLSNPYYGALWQSSRIADLVTGASSYQAYCTACGFAISPAFVEQKTAAEHLQDILTATNSEAVWSAGASGMQLKVVPYGDTAITANGTTYTPNTTPLYDLTFDDFLGAIGKDGKPTGTDPVSVTRTSVQDIKNDVPVEFWDRTASYNVSVVDSPEAADVSINGFKQDSSLSLHLITRSSHALQISKIQAQKNVYVRNTYSFKVGWKYLLLEPMDLVTLTDQITGLYRKIVRIISVEMPDETSEEDGLTITAEEWPFGIGSATLYTTQIPSGNSAASSPAPAISGAVIFEPPTLMTESGGPEIWIGASGIPTQWGGCDVWVSLDGGSSYGVAPVGTIKASTRIGTLTASLPSVTDPDTSSTLAVSLVDNLGGLNSTNAAGRDSFSTGCLVGSEIVSYLTATLTGTNAYSLTNLRRGCFGSPIAAHGAGTQFAFLDDSLLKLPYSSALIGQTVYVKFQSFNGVGSGYQSLSDCTPYGYTPSGTSYPAPPVVTVTQSATNTSGSGGSTSASDGITVTASGATAVAKVWLTITWTWSNNFPAPTGFNVIAFTGSDPTAAANYLFDMITVVANARSYAIAVTPTSSMSTVNAAVRAIYA